MEFFAPETAPFAVALTLTALIALVEAAALVFGLSPSAAIDNALPDLDVEAPDIEVPDGAPDAVELGPLSAMLSWLSFGKLPALVVLILFAAAFGLIGFLGQWALQRGLGFMLDPWIASVPALIGAAYATHFVGTPLARVFPKEHTEAVSKRDFIGRVAVVIRGEARAGLPAEAKLQDVHGKTHYMRVEPEAADQVFAEGSEVVLIRYQRGVFRAIVRLEPADGGD